MSYIDLLKDPKWQKRRLEVLDARGWKCERCDDTTSELHVHHLRYIKGLLPWQYEDEDLRVLCDAHHTEAHELEDTLKLAIARMVPQAFENVVGYAVAQAAFGFPDLFSRYKLTGCDIGGILGYIGILGKQGIKFVESRTREDGTIDMGKLLCDAQDEKLFSKEEDSEKLEIIIKLIRDLLSRK